VVGTVPTAADGTDADASIDDDCEDAADSRLVHSSRGGSSASEMRDK
jgi:hypothetical protein